MNTRKGKKTVKAEKKFVKREEGIFCGFRRVKGSHNALWNWKTMEDVSVQTQ